MTVRGAEFLFWSVRVVTVVDVGALRNGSNRQLSAFDWLCGPPQLSSPIRYASRNRLFAEHVLACVERSDGVFGVGAVRKDDVHDLDRRILGDPVEIRRIDRVGRQLMLVGNEIRLSSVGADQRGKACRSVMAVAGNNFQARVCQAQRP